MSLIFRNKIMIAFYIVLGFVMGCLTNHKLSSGLLAAFRNHFANPGTRDHKYEYSFDWFMKQLFLLFGKKTSERFYEAKAYTHRSSFVSLLCAVRFVEVVRIDYFHKHDTDCFTSITKVFPIKMMFMNNTTRLAMIMKEAKDNDNNQTGIYQIFVAGDNVVWDFMSGNLEF